MKSIHDSNFTIQDLELLKSKIVLKAIESRYALSLKSKDLLSVSQLSLGHKTKSVKQRLVWKIASRFLSGRIGNIVEGVLIGYNVVKKTKRFVKKFRRK